jgi:hypothetical protein
LFVYGEGILAMGTQHADVIDEQRPTFERFWAPEDESERAPTAPSTAPEYPTDAPTGIYPSEDTLKSALQLNAESARREDGE